MWSRGNPPRRRKITCLALARRFSEPNPKNPRPQRLFFRDLQGPWPTKRRSQGRNPNKTERANQATNHPPTRRPANPQHQHSRHPPQWKDVLQLWKFRGGKTRPSPSRTPAIPPTHQPINPPTHQPTTRQPTHQPPNPHPLPNHPATPCKWSRHCWSRGMSRKAARSCGDSKTRPPPADIERNLLPSNSMLLKV